MSPEKLFKASQETDCANSAQQTTGLEEIYQRVNLATDRIRKSATRLDEIGCRIFGQLPEEGCGTKIEDRREPEGTFEYALRGLDWLDDSLAHLERVTARIERV